MCLYVQFLMAVGTVSAVNYNRRPCGIIFWSNFSIIATISGNLIGCNTSRGSRKLLGSVVEELLYLEIYVYNWDSVDLVKLFGVNFFSVTHTEVVAMTFNDRFHLLKAFKDTTTTGPLDNLT